MPKKVYAVRAGRACGIFTTWAECKKQVDGFAGARYKGFTDVSEALAWLNGGERTLPQAAPAPRDFVGWYLKQKELRQVDDKLPVGNSLAP